MGLWDVSSQPEHIMNLKWLTLAVLVIAGTASAMARPPIPPTPAGDTLRIWLDAFNSGDQGRMESYIKATHPGVDITAMSALRGITGGYDLLSIERSEPLHVWFLLRERNTGVHVFGDLLVRKDKPPTIDSFSLRMLPPGVSPVIVTVDAAMRQRVIDGIAANLNRFYVNTALVAPMIAALRAHQKAGDYRDISDGFVLAQRLTSDLRSVSHDVHLWVRFTPFEAPPPQPPNVQQLAQMRAQIQADNCQFQKVEILPGDIGYVKFNAFLPPPFCSGTVEAAMAFVAHTRALIFDLRDNHGGDPAMVAFIISYLFDRPTHLNDIYDRARNTTTQFWTVPSVPGERLSTQPVFVLTSHGTVSGAEAFCYDLQNLKRATVVGETTLGGAHLVGGHSITDYFAIGVPFAKAINPISHTDWEGTGVVPDVKVAAADALTTAEKLATQDIQAAAAKGPPPRTQEPARTTPSPGTEASLRRQIEGWEKQQPDYADMDAGLQEATLQQRVQIDRIFERLGALKSLVFVKVGPSGWDIYDARFAHGALEWSIAPLSADGRAAGVFFRPSPARGQPRPKSH